MKNSVIITIMVALFSITSAIAQDTVDRFEIQVDGLGCPFCAYGLEKKFKEFKGIKNVAIEIETGDFSFTYPSKKNLSLEAVETQVEKAGYTPMKIKITRADGKVENSEAKDVKPSGVASSKKEVFVSGNCGMCEARIVKAASSVTGVSEASWNKDSKMLTVSFDASETSLHHIEEAVAEVGHDTKHISAKVEIYDDLPGCCKYERLEQ